MLYERESDGAIACEGHAAFEPMSEVDERSWREKVERELSRDATPCEFCADDSRRSAEFLERVWAASN